MSEMNALDNALVKLAAASTALEHHAPTIQDVEDARDSAKAAGKILDAAFTLMSCGIYSVAESPSEAKFNDPNDYQISLPEVREEIVAEEAPALVPFPGILAEFDTWGEEEQLNEFERRLDDLRASLPDADQLDLTPWDETWGRAENARDAFTRLLIAEAREPRTFNIPTDEEVATWLAQFTDLGTEPEHLVNWHGWNADEQLVQFEALLVLLEDAGVEAGLKRKAWKKALRSWQDLFIQDREKAWDLLCKAVEHNGPVSWDIPVEQVVEEPASAAEEIPADIDPFEAEGGAQ